MKLKFLGLVVTKRLIHVLLKNQIGILPHINLYKTEIFIIKKTLLESANTTLMRITVFLQEWSKAVLQTTLLFCLNRKIHLFMM